MLLSDWIMHFEYVKLSHPSFTTINDIKFSSALSSQNNSFLFLHSPPGEVVLL